MGFFKNIQNWFSGSRSAPYAEPGTSDQDSGGGISPFIPFWGLATGSVTENAALKLSAFYDGVNTISDDLAQLPIGIFRKTEKGRIAEVSHPANHLISTEPNDDYSSFIWRKLMFANAIVRGNHYTRIIRNSVTGQITELQPLDYFDVYPFSHNKQSWFRIKGLAKPVHSSELIQIRNFSLSGTSGRGVIEYAAESMGISLSVQRYGKDFFGNSSNPTGILTTDQILKGDQRKAIRDSWNQNYSGGGPKGVAVLDGNMKYQQVYLSPEQTQFISSRKFTVLDIARWLKIPPHKLKDLEKSAFTNIEQQNIDYVQSCLMSWVVQTEQELNKKLFTTEEKAAGYYVKMNVNALLRGDAASRWQSYKDGFFIGALSPNDVRELEDLNPRDGGDEYFTPVNMQTIDQIEKQLKDEPK